MRSRRACELLAERGFTNLVDMHGGMYGSFDDRGAPLEPGWATCGFEQTVEGAPERRWEHLDPSR